MEIGPNIETITGFPELTELGKRIEMLRIERGVSKQHLARFAGTSRQQLWRVMTGKSEMSIGLRARLAEVLHSPLLQLEGNGVSTELTTITATRTTTNRPTPTATTSSDCEAYLTDAARIVRTLTSMPAGDRGRLLKRRLLDAIEDESLAAGITLDRAFFELRRKVLAGQL